MPQLDGPRQTFSLSTLSGGITYGGSPPHIASPGDSLPNTERLRPLGGTATRLSRPETHHDELDDRWQPKQAESPEQELEVLKAILLREGYLKRLEQTINDWLASGLAKNAPRGLSDLWDLIRVSTVEVAERVVAWRLAVGADIGGAPMPFLWNGVNYLLKMPSDLDDLELLPSIRRWAGFGLVRAAGVYIKPGSGDDAAAGDADIPPRRAAAPPRLGRGYSVETSRGDAAAGDADIPSRRGSVDVRSRPARAHRYATPSSSRSLSTGANARKSRATPSHERRTRRRRTRTSGRRASLTTWAPRCRVWRLSRRRRRARTAPRSSTTPRSFRRSGSTPPRTLGWTAAPRPSRRRRRRGGTNAEATGRCGPSSARRT